ncbi:uncharacterized protein UTRI_02805 [Ustilago trichophora]|uniref:6-phosphogluconolactonase n=1 Tax=Ustilago trichophora TaxID=86804 RepID=A0A5C3ENW7_9BASI|nr:uncharacterized protein UTRI_02805 [Ustilago trichophora]
MTLFAAGYNGTIVPYSIDPSQGKLAPVSSGIKPNSSGTSPSWIAYSHTRSHFKSKTEECEDDGNDVFYAVTDFYAVDESAPGRVFSHTYDSETGTIVQTGTTDTQRTKGSSSGGDGPVSCLIGHGPSRNLLFVANYGSGSAGVLTINPKDGTLSETPKQVFQFTRPPNAPKVGPVPDRQDHSYAHQVSISPSGKWVYVCDLGADQIHHLHITHRGEVKFTGSTDVKVGSGPRHITFHRDAGGRVFAYLASELDNTVSAFSVNEETGELNLIGAPIIASPPGVPLSGEGILPTNRTTAEIAVVPAGDFVYVSDRGDMTEDHISIFKRDQGTGQLEFLEWVGSGGRMPRHFSLSSDTAKDKDAKWLAVGHQTDQNIVLFERNVKSGMLTKVDTRTDVGQVAFTGFSPF